jgi:hypothetical protein
MEAGFPGPLTFIVPNFTAIKTGEDLVGDLTYDLFGDAFSRDWACQRSTARRHRSIIFFRSAEFAFVNSPLYIACASFRRERAGLPRSIQVKKTASVLAERGRPGLPGAGMNTAARGSTPILWSQ